MQKNYLQTHCRCLSPSSSRRLPQDRSHESNSRLPDGSLMTLSFNNLPSQITRYASGRKLLMMMARISGVKSQRKADSWRRLSGSGWFSTIVSMKLGSLCSSHQTVSLSIFSLHRPSMVSGIHRIAASYPGSLSTKAWEAQGEVARSPLQV